MDHGMNLTIGVTGHRNLLADELPGLRERVREFLEDLAGRFPGLELTLVSGLAEGADQLVAEVALEMGLPHVAVLPFAADEYARDFTQAEAVDTFHALLAQSEVIELPPMPGSSAEAIRLDTSFRDRQYAQLGVFISNHCQVLLALWDGQEADGVGGTGAVVNYHLTAVMPGFAVAEESPNLLADNENDLAYHIVCSRKGADWRPDYRFQSLETYWVTAHFGRQPGDALPEEYRRMLDRLQAYSDDARRHAEEIDAQASGLLGNAPPLDRPEGVAHADRQFAMTDWLAIHYQKRFSSSLLFSHVLAVGMGLTFIFYSEMVEQIWLAWLFLVLFAIGLVIHVAGEKREWHRKYLDYRALAEGLRVQVYWNLAGVVDSRAAEFAYDNFLQKQDVDLAWIRHVMRYVSLRSFQQRAPDEGWVDWVADQWVGQAEAPGGQLNYYRSKAGHRSTVYRRTLRLGNLALWTGIFMALCLGLFASRMGDDQILVFMILMGVLPLIAGVRDTYSHKKADKELIKQYQFEVSPRLE